jgi:hypothetical protein
VKVLFADKPLETSFQEYIHKCMTTALQVVVVLFLLTSCGSGETEHIEAVQDRSAMPKLHAMDVNSGI